MVVDNRDGRERERERERERKREVDRKKGSQMTRVRRVVREIFNQFMMEMMKRL